MIGASLKFEDRTKRVEKAADRAAFRNLGHAVASIRKTAQASMDRSAEPSPPGQPPHTRRGQMPRSITFDNDREREEAIVGPRYSVVGEAGAAHEFGEFFRGAKFDERSFMLPALNDNLDRFHSDWAGSIGE